jgi:hypothetical protein
MAPFLWFVGISTVLVEGLWYANDKLFLADMEFPLWIVFHTVIRPLQGGVFGDSSHLFHVDQVP